MPTDAPIETAVPLIVYGRERLSMIPCASSDSSSCADVAGRTTSNSSPPSRPTCPTFANHVAKPQGNQPEQRITRRVAERIVHRLEPVEVEQEDGATVLSAGRADQGIVQRAAKGFAVGKAGQRILPGKPVELDLRLPDLGQVGCEAAVAEEASDLVMDGTAGDRPPDLVLGLRPDDEVLKGHVRQQIEAERPFRSRTCRPPSRSKPGR